MINTTNGPMVSVIVTTYNHGKYIRQTLEGILMQDVDFKYEIIVHDDASPDNTADIVREYEKKYPDIIRAIYQTENQYSKGILIQSFYFKYLTGKYIAHCEGDDYWTDPNKLKKQVDFLESNENFIGTAHNVKVIDENDLVTEDRSHIFQILRSYVYTLDHAREYKLPGQLASLVYRNIWTKLSDEVLRLYGSCKANGDRKLAVLLAVHGDIFCFSDVMSTYRSITSQGTSWSARTHGKNLSLHYYNSLIEIDKFSTKAFGVRIDNKSKRLETLSSAFFTMLKHPGSENIGIFKKIIELNTDKILEVSIRILHNGLKYILLKIKRAILSK